MTDAPNYGHVEVPWTNHFDEQLAAPLRSESVSLGGSHSQIPRYEQGRSRNRLGAKKKGRMALSAGDVISSNKSKQNLFCHSVLTQEKVQKSTLIQ